VFYDPVYAGFIDRDLATATTTVRGGTAFGIYPFNRYRRVEFSGGLIQYDQKFNDPSLQEISADYQEQQFGQQLLQSGFYVPLGVTYVQETTVFREFGPLSGNTMRLRYEVAPKIAGALDRQTLDADARFYQRIGASGLLALRARGFRSWGGAPDFMYFGGNSEMRGYDYLQFVGSQSAFFNAELRFPLIEAMLTPLGVMGGIRGVFFANMGGSHFEGQPFRWLARGAETYTPIIGYKQTSLVTQEPIFGVPQTVDGLRLVDSRASYGVGLETFALGFPIHIDWSWKTLFNKDWENMLFAAYGGSEEFRKPKVSFWIGYDF
jgi:outer membrane protein assembly factor BamA